MTTVPGPDTPAPADNHMVHTVSDAKSHDYGRPTAGNNSEPGGSQLGPGASAPDAPAGAVPGYAINLAGADVGVGNTQTADEVFQGTTLIVPQPDATGHPLGDTSGGGTVGDSGPQGASPGEIPPVSGMADIDHDGDAV